LRGGGIVERYEDGRGRRLLRLTVDLQANFALNQPLSPFALAAIELLDPESDDYALDVISVIEATLEDPRAILRAQEHKARGEAVAAMKAEGIEYDERMELLEEVTHPQPLKPLLDEAFQEYAKEVPWARDFELHPKSVVRDMVERAFGFRDLVSFYQLGRAEGGVLRYLSDAYRAIERTVPEQAKSPELEDLIEWLGELVRQVDSSLIDEWQSLSDPDPDPEALRRARELLGLDAGDADGAVGSAGAAPLAPPARSLLANERAFLVMLRNALFRYVQAAAFERYEELAELDAAHAAAHAGIDRAGAGGPGAIGFGEQRWRDALSGYYAEYDEIRIDADARAPALLELDRGDGTSERSERSETSETPEGSWRFRQVLLDPDGDRDWGIEGVVDLVASEAEGAPVVRVERVGSLAGA
ncbi:MAG: DUF3516 domain-containing protein, partial [Leucobacter sp.]